MKEQEVFRFLSKKVEQIFQTKAKPIRIAINGIEGTGKTIFANKFSEYLNVKGKNAVQVTIDGFHFNKGHRYKKGRDSAIGYYKDSYNEMSFVEKVLISSQNEPPLITTATHDLKTDEYLDLKPIEIKNDTILITDGAYLFKPNYRDYWDLKIYLKTDFTTALNRGIERDKESLGGTEAAKKMFQSRYHKASTIYINEIQPEKIADVIIDITDFRHLKILKR